MTYLPAATQTNPSRFVSLYSQGFIIVGVLHMCFRSNHKSQAYVHFCKKIIYPSTSLYKVCSKKGYLSLGTELLQSPGKERGESSPAPLWLQHHPVEKALSDSNEWSQGWGQGVWTPRSMQSPLKEALNTCFCERPGTGLETFEWTGAQF